METPPTISDLLFFHRKPGCWEMALKKDFQPQNRDLGSPQSFSCSSSNISHPTSRPCNGLASSQGSGFLSANLISSAIYTSALRKRPEQEQLARIYTRCSVNHRILPSTFDMYPSSAVPCRRWRLQFPHDGFLQMTPFPCSWIPCDIQMCKACTCDFRMNTGQGFLWPFRRPSARSLAPRLWWMLILLTSMSSIPRFSSIVAVLGGSSSLRSSNWLWKRIRTRTMRGLRLLSP